MAHFCWPYSIIPSTSSLTLRDGSGRFTSPFTGSTRTVSRPGATRLSLEVSFTGLQDSKRGTLMATLAALEGASGRVWLRDHSYVQRGSFPATELIGNVAFTGTTGWTSSNAEMTLSAVDGELRLTRTGVTGDRYAYYSQITGLTSGAAYALRVVMSTGQGPEAWAGRVGSSAGDNSYIDTGLQASDGLAVTGGAIGATTAYVSIYDYILDSVSSPNEGRSAGDYQRFAGVSLSRCFLTNGAGQTGTGIVVDALPASTNGLLLPGDQFQLCNELKIVTAPLNSDSGGNGYLQFAPALRSPTTDNCAIVVHKPMGKFLLSDNDNGWQSVPGIHSNAQVSFVEAVD